MAETTICAHCGQARNEHWLVNYCDPPNIGQYALLCPTAIFKERK